MKNNYVLGVGEQGRKRLEIVDLLYGLQTKFFLQNNIKNKGIRVLDLGCGLGHTSRILSDIIGPEGEVIAIDNSPEQLEIAKELSKDFSNIKYSCIDITNDSFNEIGKYNVIYGRLILTHIKNAQNILNSIRKKILKNGIILLEEPITSASSCYPNNNWFDMHLDLYIKLGKLNGLNYDFGYELFNIINNLELKIDLVNYYQSLHNQKNIKEISILRTIECSEKYLINKLITTENLDILLDNLKKIIADEKYLFSGAKMCQFVIRDIN